MKIYICCHKHCQTPTSDVLQPIHAGKAISDTDLDMLCDNTGDNISIKNRHYCELTAAYWIWKNVKEDIVGLCHYRRYFNFKNDHTKINKIKPDFSQWSGNTKETLFPLFKEYDLILPTKAGSRKHPKTIYDSYEQEHIISDLDVCLDIIKEKYPHQYQTASKVLHDETRGYYANMLVAKKKVFDNYAKWLFDILFELEKRIQKDVETRDTYQQRVYGFLSERLITVYVALHPELKVKELPIIFVEENKKMWHKYIFHYWKTKTFAILGIKRRKNG